METIIRDNTAKVFEDDNMLNKLHYGFPSKCIRFTRFFYYVFLASLA